MVLAVREICFPFERDMGIDASDNLDRFNQGVTQVVETYRRLMIELPEETDLSPADVLEAAASIPVSRIRGLAGDRASLKTAILRRHVHLAEARPVTETNVKAVASTLSRKATHDNCVELAASFLARIFPKGIRTPAVRNDLSVASNRVEDLLAPGAVWSKVMSMKQVFQALEVRQEETIAVLLQQRNKGVGHVLLYVRVKSPEGHGWKNLRVDLQAEENAVTDVSSRNSTMPHMFSSADPSALRHQDQEWLHAGRGTRMIVIDHTGQSIEPEEFPVDLIRPESSSLAQGQVEAPTSHGYGAIGWEIEISDQRIVTADKSKFPADVVLAESFDGFKLKADRAPFWYVDGRGFLSQAEAASFSAKEPVKGAMDILEIISPPHRALPGESGNYPDIQNGIGRSNLIRSQLSESTRQRRAIPLRELLKEGWTHNANIPQVSVYPAIASGAYVGPYSQVTVGSHIAGASLLVALAQDLISDSRKSLRPAVEIARAFARDLAAAFASSKLDRKVDSWQVPFLFSVIPHLLEVDAYAWLMFNHASAWPITKRFFEGTTTKNRLPAALRNPFHVLRKSLSTDVREFLRENESVLYSQFQSRLLEAMESYAKIKGKGPKFPVENIMNEPAFESTTTQEYLTSMIRGTSVTQYEMVGMDDQRYQRLDTSNGKLPLALFEFRSLSHMNNATLENTIHRIHSVAKSAHETALYFDQWDHSRTLARANRVLGNPLVQSMQSVLPRLMGLRVPGSPNSSDLILPLLDHLLLVRAIADHAVTGRPLSNEASVRIEAIRSDLAQAFSAQSSIPQQDQRYYLDALQRLDHAMYSGLSSRPVRAAMAFTDDAMRVGLKRALLDARSKPNPNEALIAGLETQLQTWSREDSQNSVPEDTTGPSDGEPDVLSRGTEHDSPAAHSQEHTAPAPRLAPTPTPIEARATGQDGVALGALWRGPQDREALLAVRQVTTATLEIGDFIPHDLRNDLDALTNNRPADTT
ncbi:hypothetical protein ACFZBE_41215, partial [Streptomyces sp. NPDC008061]|uniref:hypothetical protein n=1 Tax=Streptomyces sp. NPDC008061 TaxID=3364805 RepID=UPI0036EC3431